MVVSYNLDSTLPPPQQRCAEPILLLCICPRQGNYFGKKCKINRNVQIQANLQKCAWVMMFIIQMWNKLKRLENRGYKQMSIKLRSSSSEVGKLLWWKDHDFHNSDIIKIKTLGKRELQRSIKLRSSISKVHKLLW